MELNKINSKIKQAITLDDSNNKTIQKLKETIKKTIKKVIKNEYNKYLVDNKTVKFNNERLGFTAFDDRTKTMTEVEFNFVINEMGSLIIEVRKTII